MKSTLLIICASIYITCITCITIKPLYDDYTTSSECVRKYVVLGIERADIKVNGGECHL